MRPAAFALRERALLYMRAEQSRNRRTRRYLPARLEHLRVEFEVDLIDLHVLLDVEEREFEFGELLVDDLNAL